MTDTITPPSLPDYEPLPDSRRIMPTLDERVRDLEARHDSVNRSRADHEKRLRDVEAWPRRLIVAVVGGALGMIATMAGFGWSLSAQLARLEATSEASAESDARRDDRIDRLEDRAWQRVDTTTHASEP